MTLDRQRVIDALPNYEVGEELGRGGWAVVLHARHRILEREVAVKHLPVAFGADPTVRARFVAEARLVAQLDHPHIVPVYDFVESNGTYLILMEFLPGGSLWEKFLHEGVRYDEACAYILVACSALEHAHERGTLHRDIKPENFLIDDRPGVIKLSDFGIAKALGAAASHFTTAGQIVGTPAYMAPEQILGRQPVPATDVYACATMLYEFLTGELPYPEGASPIEQLTVKVRDEPRAILEVQPAVPRPIATVVMRALALDPADRYPTAHEFGEELAHAATRAFGTGWLPATGVRLDGAPHLIGITERPVTASVRITDQLDPIKATMTHARLGELMAAARQGGSAGESAPGTEAGSDAGSEVSATPAAPVSAAPAGWFPDPLARFALRYWDGASWTAHASNGGEPTLDPL